MHIKSLDSNEMNYKSVLRVKNPVNIINRNSMTTLCKADEVSIDASSIESIVKNAKNSNVSIITKRTIYEVLGDINFDYLNKAYQASKVYTEAIYDSAKRTISHLELNFISKPDKLKEQILNKW